MLAGNFHLFGQFFEVYPEAALSTTEWAKKQESIQDDMVSGYLQASTDIIGTQEEPILPQNIAAILGSHQTLKQLIDAAKTVVDTQTIDGASAIKLCTVLQQR